MKIKLKFVRVYFSAIRTWYDVCIFSQNNCRIFIQFVLLLFVPFVLHLFYTIAYNLFRKQKFPNRKDDRKHGNFARRPTVCRDEHKIENNKLDRKNIGAKHGSYIRWSPWVQGDKTGHATKASGVQRFQLKHGRPLRLSSGLAADVHTSD